MRTFVIGALATVAFARRGQGRVGGAWWGAAPECAQTCLSSAYEEEASMTEWPLPGHFCTASASSPLESCLSSECTESATAYSSMSSLSSSLCSAYASCTGASDEVYTLTYSSPTGTGRYAGGGPWRTFTGDGTVTVTGCPTDGFGWGVGMGGRSGFMPWNDENPDDAFWGWGAGWSDMTTVTETVTSTITAADGAVSETLVLETFLQAVSDGVTTTSALGATDGTGPTGTGLGAGESNVCVGTGTNSDCVASATEESSTDNGSPDDGDSAASVKEVTFVGAALAAVVAVAGLL